MEEEPINFGSSSPFKVKKVAVSSFQLIRIRGIIMQITCRSKGLLFRG